MLKELYIKNIAVVDELRLGFDQGFHIFTGETGAGKSILGEAISLVLGEKPKSNLLRDGSDEAIVEASFAIAKNPEVQTFLKQYSLENTEDPEELILKRQLSSEGKNKVFVNHQRSTLKILQEVAALLIDLTGQHEQMELLTASQDREILDEFLTKKDILEVYAEQYSKTKGIFQKISDLKKTIAEKERRLEGIQFQLKEMGDLEIHSEEEEAGLREKRNFLRHQSQIAEFSSNAGKIFEDALGSFHKLETTFERNSYLNDYYKNFSSSLKEVKILIEDLSFEISKQTAHLETQISLDDLERKLYVLERLKTKYGPEFKDVLKKKAELEAEKGRLENSNEVISDLEVEFTKNFSELKNLTQKLMEHRQKIAKMIEKLIMVELTELQMPEAKFSVQIEEKDRDDFQNYSQSGCDRVCFLISPNPGFGLKPLSQIASGGETSRLFLAIKQVLTRHKKSGTLIFDEIDTGISGAVVELAGRKLKKLADRFQVFCITHHAQIASLADKHFLVSKEIQKGKTFTRVNVLKDQDRIQEVARLMGGVEITSKNMAFAKEILRKK